MTDADGGSLRRGAGLVREPKWKGGF